MEVTALGVVQGMHTTGVGILTEFLKFCLSYLPPAFTFPSLCIKHLPILLIITLSLSWKNASIYTWILPIPIEGWPLALDPFSYIILQGLKVGIEEGKSQARSFPCHVYWFPMSAITNYYKCSGLKQHKMFILQFSRPEGWREVHWVKCKVSAGQHAFLENV